MKKKLSEWMNKAREIEAAIGARVEGAANRSPAGTRQPLEIVHEIVDHIATEVQPSGRGRRVFPYTHVRVAIRTATAKDRAKLEAACEGPPSLQERVHERLRSAGCSLPAPVVKLVLVTAAKPDWRHPDFHVDFSRGAVTAPPDPPAATESPRCKLELSVTAGVTEQNSYVLTSGVFAIGRGAEVRDSQRRLLRTNQLVFTEGGGNINASVSRRHARIECEAAAGAFRLHDDAGGERTSVVRDGRGLRVPQGRGLRLRSGDVLALGDARISVTIE